MPKYTKEQLQAELEKLGDGESFTAFSQDELNTHIDRRIAEINEKQIGPAEQRVKDLTTERDQVLAKLQAIKSEADRKGKSETELLTAEITKRDEQIAAWQTKQSESEAAIQAMAQTRRTEHLQNTFTALFSTEGATKAANPATAVREVMALASNAFELEENGQGLNIKTYDLENPSLKAEVPIAEWGKAFLDKNPHLKVASASGAPLNPATPTGDPKIDPMAGKSVGERMEIATRETYALERK